MDMVWLLEAGKYAAAVAAIIGTIVMLIKFVFVKPLKIFIKETVEESTKPIQKDSNGGFSLADANKKLNNLDKRLDTLEEDRNKRLDTVEETLQQMLDLLTKPKPRTRQPKKDI